MNFSSGIPLDDLSLIEQRCRLKADGARWAAERQRVLSSHSASTDASDAKYRQLIQRGVEAGAYLWMIGPDAPRATQDLLWQDIEFGFGLVADLLCLIQEVTLEQSSVKGLFKEAVFLLAEAQSDLRWAISTVSSQRDSDQIEVFQWLLQTAYNEGWYIESLRLDYEPVSRNDIRAHFSDVESAFHRIQERRQVYEECLGRVSSQAELIVNGNGTDDEWRDIIVAIEEATKAGLPPSNVMLRESLLPILHAVPDFCRNSAAFQLVQREIERARSSNRPLRKPATRPPNTEILTVRKFLQKRGMLLLGGIPRPFARESIASAFGLRQLVWPEIHESDPPSLVEPLIAQAETAVVLLAIRWIRYRYTEFVPRTCAKFGKAFVRLPTGYSSNQIAHQIVRQLNL